MANHRHEKVLKINSNANFNQEIPSVCSERGENQKCDDNCVGMGLKQ